MNGYTTRIRKLTQNLNEIDEANKPYKKAIIELRNIENVEIKKNHNYFSIQNFNLNIRCRKKFRLTS